MTDLDRGGPERTRLEGLSLELPAQGTGVRAARRAAREQAERERLAHDQLAREREAPLGPGGERAREPVLPPAARRSTPAGAGRGLTRRFLVTFVGGLVACALVAGALLVLGVRTLRDSRAGRTVTSSQPHEPGYEAFLEPTPTLAVAHVHEGELHSVAVLSLGLQEQGGGVMLVPPETLVGDGQLGTLALARAFGAVGEQLRPSVESVAGAGITELVEVDDARWAQLVAPVAPIVLQNPDDLPGFPAGQLALAPEDVGPFLRARADGESDLSRHTRIELFWQAWLQAVADRSGAVPGEVDAGMGRFVRGLAAGPRQVATLPVSLVELEDGATAFAVDEVGREALIVRLIPYPTGTVHAPRSLVRLLDGTGDTGAVGRHAPTVVGARASIVVVGNADRFDYEVTQILFHRPEVEVEARRLRDALGVGEVVEDVRPIDAFGVTIVIGRDLEEQP